MSFRLEMLQVARLAPATLGDAAHLIRDFVLSQQNPDGGFRDRAGKSDLYYTVFAIDSLTALQSPLPDSSLIPYLRSFATGEHLDFVHLCCLARAWSALPKPSIPNRDIAEILLRIESFRTPDGGYSQKPASTSGSAYGCLLASGAYSDHGQTSPDKPALARCLDSLRTPDGGWSNDPGMSEGVTTATAAAVTLLRHLHRTPDQNVGPFLLSNAHPGGGFLAFPRAPMPDLLSTAVALHALDGIQHPFDKIKEHTLDFVDSLWVADGGFYGHWADDTLDLEYTYYGLLALGHLSL